MCNISKCSGRVFYAFIVVVVGSNADWGTTMSVWLDAECGHSNTRRAWPIIFCELVFYHIERIQVATFCWKCKAANTLWCMQQPHCVIVMVLTVSHYTSSTYNRPNAAPTSGNYLFVKWCPYIKNIVTIFYSLYGRRTYDFLQFNSAAFITVLRSRISRAFRWYKYILLFIDSFCVLRRAVVVHTAKVYKLLAHHTELVLRQGGSFHQQQQHDRFVQIIILRFVFVWWECWYRVRTHQYIARLLSK